MVGKLLQSVTKLANLRLGGGVLGCQESIW